MDASFSKLYIALGGGVVGAILGGCLAGWRAAAAASAAAATDPDLIARANPLAFGATATLVLKGIFIGGIAGLALALVVLYLVGTERIRIERKFKDTE